VAEAAGVKIDPEGGCGLCGGDHGECPSPLVCQPTPCPPGLAPCPGSCVSPFPK
jgi:hypothetical protein